MIKSCNFYYFNERNFVTISTVDYLFNEQPFLYNYWIDSFDDDVNDCYGGTGNVYVKVFIKLSKFGLFVHSPMKFP